MQVFLETERLVLRRFTGADAGDLFELDGDPEVMRFLTGGKPMPREVILAETLPRFPRSYGRLGGLGYWASLERSPGGFLGWFALHPSEGGDQDEADLGYRLRRPAWGKGYATEGARALIHKGFTELGVGRVVAETVAANAASRRVMEKAGLYALTRTGWELRGAADPGRPSARRGIGRAG